MTTILTAGLALVVGVATGWQAYRRLIGAEALASLALARSRADEAVARVATLAEEVAGLTRTLDIDTACTASATASERERSRALDADLVLALAQRDEATAIGEEWAAAYVAQGAVLAELQAATRDALTRGGDQVAAATAALDAMRLDPADTPDLVAVAGRRGIPVPDAAARAALASMDGWRTGTWRVLPVASRPLVLDGVPDWTTETYLDRVDEPPQDAEVVPDSIAAVSAVSRMTSGAPRRGKRSRAGRAA